MVQDTVLVTCGTGNIGSAVVALLAGDARAHPRGVARSQRGRRVQRRDRIDERMHRRQLRQGALRQVRHVQTLPDSTSDALRADVQAAKVAAEPGPQARRDRR